MPLVQMAASTVQTTGAQPMPNVFADDGRSMGLVVDQIIDIVEEGAPHRGRGLPRRASSAPPP